MKNDKTVISENEKNLSIYHYVEELIYSYQKYVIEEFRDNTLSQKEYILLARIRYLEGVTQKELANQYNLTEGYTAKLLHKLEENNLIERTENPDNRRQKIVSLTGDGYEYTNKINRITNEWEGNITSNITEEELKLLKSILNKMI
ncbi:MAG: MarR family transcriptional regulator [Methanosphaera stadtmanae]|nr:MarR family transcriptional regulator [Methanosphaera stadtmanae]